MLHPTRTNLLLLKEKSRSVANSIGILKARRQALIRELLSASLPYLRSREELRQGYGRAIEEMQLARGHEGESGIASVVAVSGGEMWVEIRERSVMGLHYLDLERGETPVRTPRERGYDYRLTTPHLEEAIFRFETVMEAMLANAAFESKLKRLGEEIARVTRRTRVLEERLLPELRREVRGIAQYIGEREREAFYRLKRFKSWREETVREPPR